MLNESSRIMFKMTMKTRTVNILRVASIMLALLALYLGIQDGQVKSVFIKAIYI